MIDVDDVENDDDDDVVEDVAVAVEPLVDKFQYRKKSIVMLETFVYKKTNNKKKSIC